MGPAKSLLIVLSLATVASAQLERSEHVHQRRIEIEAPWGRVPVWVGFPRRRDRRESPPGHRYPVLIAIHGRGESHSPARGAQGWSMLYDLPAAFGVLMRG